MLVKCVGVRTAFTLKETVWRVKRCVFAHNSASSTQTMGKHGNPLGNAKVFGPAPSIVSFTPQPLAAGGYQMDANWL